MEAEITHGGDWAGYQLAYGRLPLDFSSNVSPLGVPEGVRTAIQKAAFWTDRYPDPLCRELRAALAEKEGVPASHILCGNGAAELIFRAVLALRPRRALITAPTFSEYETALHCAGCRVERYMLLPCQEFRVQEDILEKITPDTDILFLCEPNNPTGITTSRALLLQILERCREMQTRLLLDACFGEFLEEAHTWKDQMEARPQIVILKAFTKLYAMAGVRLGYVLCGDTALLEKMRSAGPAWSVSSLAQKAGIAALKETAYAERVRALVKEQRPILAAALKGLGFSVIPGEANYLLFQSRTPLVEPLKEKGILLRACGNYVGLDETWYRAAIRTAEENRRLILALKEALE